MFDHIGITVSDLERSKAFYRAALAPLGLVRGAEFPGWTSFGPPGKPRFWIAQGKSGASAPRVHIAFKADRAGVDAFYAAAMAAGGVDNGAPGPRPHYHEHYYGAFVIDPDGYNVEAVCHDAPHARPPRAARAAKKRTRASAKKKPAPTRKKSRGR